MRRPAPRALMLNVIASLVIGATGQGCPVAPTTCDLPSGADRACACRFRFVDGCDEPVGAHLLCSGVPIPSVLPAGRTSVLPVSSGAQLLILSWVVSGAKWHAIAGRSYDGHEWERRLPSLTLLGGLNLNFSCSRRLPTCEVFLPQIEGNGSWVIQHAESDRAPSVATPRPQRAAARFLTQSTFGASRSTVADMVSRLEQEGCANLHGPAATACETRVFAAWIRQQMALTPTLHRAYWRKRTNPPTREPRRRWVPTGDCRRDGAAPPSGGDSPATSCPASIPACSCEPPGPLRLLENALDSPSEGLPHPDATPGAGQCIRYDCLTACPTVPKTFLNQHSCVPMSGACAPTTYDATPLHLNASTLRQFYELGAVLVYVVKGLRLEGWQARRSPCSGGSRWLVGPPDCEETPLDAETKATLAEAIRQADDVNPYVPRPHTVHPPLVGSSGRRRRVCPPPW